GSAPRMPFAHTMVESGSTLHVPEGIRNLDAAFRDGRGLSQIKLAHGLLNRPGIRIVAGDYKPSVEALFGHDWRRAGLGVARSGHVAVGIVDGRSGRRAACEKW